MFQDAARFIADLERLIGVPDRLALAVSGGPDSMALLTLAATAYPGRVIAATVDHCLRPESVDEAAMVAAHCAAVGVAHATLVPDTPIVGASLQAQARAARYALLANWAGGAPIATAHHADDQAETLVMRAARGSGLSGLAGIRPGVAIAGARIVRPLLDWRRAELRAIVRRERVPFVDDPSNHDLRHDRARVRHLLEANEWLDAPRLARSAAALAEADAALRATADWVWGERAVIGEANTGTTVTIDAGGLPRPLLRLLARRAIGVAREGAGVTAPEWSDAANIEPLLDALATGKRATQAGIVVTPGKRSWRFREAPPRRSL